MYVCNIEIESKIEGYIRTYVSLIQIYIMYITLNIKNFLRTLQKQHNNKPATKLGLCTMLF